MYTLTLPPDLVRRLWRLRETCGRGSIRSQALAAVGTYLEEAELEHGLDSQEPGGDESDCKTSDPLRRE